MSQKTLFTKSALAVAVAIIYHPGLVCRLSVKRIFFLWPWPGPIRVKAQSQMMRVTLAATRR